MKFLEYDNVAKQYNMEVRAIEGSAERKARTDRFLEFKDRVAAMKARYKALLDKGGRAGLINEKSEADRQRLMDTSQRLKSQNEKISGAIQSVAQTEVLGQDIMAELRQNREKIEGSQEKARDVSAVLDGAQKTIRSMERRDKCPMM